MLSKDQAAGIMAARYNIELWEALEAVQIDFDCFLQTRADELEKKSIYRDHASYVAWLTEMEELGHATV